MMAIKIRGDALAPAVMDGEILIVETASVGVPGDKVLVQLEDGSRLCKRMLYERADTVAFSDLASTELMTIERARLKGVWPISAVYGATRWRP